MGLFKHVRGWDKHAVHWSRGAQESCAIVVVLWLYVQPIPEYNARESLYVQLLDTLKFAIASP